MLLLVTSAPVPVLAASKYKACSRLTAGELETALQAKVTRSEERDVVIDQGAYKGETMSTCFWLLGSTYANLNIVRASRTPQERDAFLSMLRGVEDKLVKQGWSIARTKIGSAACAAYKPPAGATDVLPGASCMMESKGLAFYFGVSGSARVTAQQVASLAGKVAARLP
jgi:hypothetical protein